MNTAELVELIKRHWSHQPDPLLTTRITNEKVEVTYPFSEFVVKYHRTGRQYKFPKGTLGVICTPATESISEPFILERYTHPFLQEIDMERQELSLKHLPQSQEIAKYNLSQRIKILLDTGIHTLRMCGGEKVDMLHGGYRYLSDPAFDRFLVEID